MTPPTGRSQGRASYSAVTTERDSRFGLDPTRVFDPVAALYRAARPGYPDALYEFLDETAGGLAGKDLVDLGAGTGIATTVLAERGASVVAVDPSVTMLGELALISVAGRAEGIPLRDGSADLVTCAQAWHWVDPALALAECRRVLRPGGYLALWWNVSGSGAAWLQEVEEVSGLVPYGVGEHQDDPEILGQDGLFADVGYRDICWTWTVPTEVWLTVAATRSAMARLGEAAEPSLGAIREVLELHFPQGMVSEAFTCHLVLARAA